MDGNLENLSNLKEKKLNLEFNIIRNMKEQKGNKKGSLQ